MQSPIGDEKKSLLSSLNNSTHEPKNYINRLRPCIIPPTPPSTSLLNCNETDESSFRRPFASSEEVDMSQNDISSKQHTSTSHIELRHASPYSTSENRHTKITGGSAQHRAFSTNVLNVDELRASLPCPTQHKGSISLLVPTPLRQMNLNRQRHSTSFTRLFPDRIVPHDDNVSIMSGGSAAYAFKMDEEDDEENGTLPCLVLSRLERIPLKDFSSEIRASLDIEKFVKESTLMLDLEGSDLEDIINSMLKNVFSNMETEVTDLDVVMNEARKALFLEATYQDHAYLRLSKTIKGISFTEGEGLSTDQTWLCAMCSLTTIHKRHVAIARLSSPVNLGRSSEGVYFIVLIITPKREKGTKSEIELGRTFSTLFSDSFLRLCLLECETVEQFKQELEVQAKELADAQRHCRRRSINVKEVMDQAFHVEHRFPIGNGIVSDLKKRVPLYFSDIVDGVRGKRTIRKLISTTIFLYFACLLPSVAFGVLNARNTDDNMDVKRMIISQAVGGLCFGIFGGQPLIVLLTTAPLSLYLKVIFVLSQAYNVDFFSLFACVGLFNAMFLTIYALIDMSNLMKWSTRSTEEIFAFFVSIAFIVDATRDLLRVHRVNYTCANTSEVSTFPETLENASSPSSIFKNWSSRHLLGVTTKIFLNHDRAIAMYNKDHDDIPDHYPGCHKEVYILYILLMIGTVWLGTHLLNFTRTPYLNAGKREMLADFALPLSVLLMSIIGSYIFKDIHSDSFNAHPNRQTIKPIPFHKLSWLSILGALALAFPLSLLFFMDQNISSAMVNCPANKLKKSSAYHWDLLVVGIINAGLSVFGLPWIHGALPHSPLHVKALADLEERIDQGHSVHQTIVRVRETRLTSIFANILVGFSLLLFPSPLSYIPVPVLNGLFIYMAITALMDNQLFERLLLLFTEQAAYPPSHYLRRVPQRKLHMFTGLQLIQLVVLCIFGFAPNPYMKMVFPVLLLMLLVMRHKVIPQMIEDKYLDALDRPF